MVEFRLKQRTVVELDYDEYMLIGQAIEHYYACDDSKDTTDGKLERIRDKWIENEPSW